MELLVVAVMQSIMIPRAKVYLQASSTDPRTGQEWTLVGQAGSMELDVDHDDYSFSADSYLSNYSNETVTLTFTMDNVDGETLRIMVGDSTIGGQDGLDLLRKVLG